MSISSMGRRLLLVVHKRRTGRDHPRKSGSARGFERDFLLAAQVGREVYEKKKLSYLLEWVGESSCSYIFKGSTSEAYFSFRIIFSGTRRTEGKRELLSHGVAKGKRREMQASKGGQFHSIPEGIFGLDFRESGGLTSGGEMSYMKYSVVGAVVQI